MFGFLGKLFKGEKVEPTTSAQAVPAVATDEVQPIKPVPLKTFDDLFAQLNAQDPTIVKSFGSDIERMKYDLTKIIEIRRALLADDLSVYRWRFSTFNVTAVREGPVRALTIIFDKPPQWPTTWPEGVTAKWGNDSAIVLACAASKVENLLEALGILWATANKKGLRLVKG